MYKKIKLKNNKSIVFSGATYFKKAYRSDCKVFWLLPTIKIVSQNEDEYYDIRIAFLFLSIAVGVSFRKESKSFTVFDNENQ